MKLDKKALQTIKEYLIGQPVKKAYLFGSHARGTADAASEMGREAAGEVRTFLETPLPPPRIPCIFAY
ncbi:MAG: nucleotidyltransferase domain-containing protein [Candidatus Electrothrix sp. EH2]|nr:nucleotidyltransferase domain-containing protein [Candidatus Electrothrix sp. EH2]